MSKKKPAKKQKVKKGTIKKDKNPNVVPQRPSYDLNKLATMLGKKKSIVTKFKSKEELAKSVARDGYILPSGKVYVSRFAPTRGVSVTKNEKGLIVLNKTAKKSYNECKYAKSTLKERKLK